MIVHTRTLWQISYIYNMMILWGIHPNVKRMLQGIIWWYTKEKIKKLKHKEIYKKKVKK